MAKSSVNTYSSDLEDDGLCLTNSNISTNSFFRRKYKNSTSPTSFGSGEIHNFNIDTYESPCLSEDRLQSINSFEAFNTLEHDEVGEAPPKYSPILTFDTINLYERKKKKFVSFDSDRESIEEEEDEPVESIVDNGESSIKLVKSRFCRWLLRFIHRTRRIRFRQLPYRVRFKLIVMGLKCIQIVFALLWTLITFLEPHLNHWVAGRFKWINYICLGLYFLLYFTVRFVGFLHGFWELVMIFVIFTLSNAHVTAVTSISTGSLMMPVTLGLVLFIGLNYMIISCGTTEKHCCGDVYRVGIIVFIVVYLMAIVTCITMGSLYVDEGLELNKQMAGGHCALVIGAFYAAYIIYEIRMFLNGNRLALDGVKDDYILAAVVI